MLLVEDDPNIRAGLSRALSERGHAVSSAPTGAQAPHLVMSEHPDLVVLDLGLPDLDGRDVLAMLRAVDDVPVIVATARDGDRKSSPFSRPAPTTTWSSRSVARNCTRGSEPSRAEPAPVRMGTRRWSSAPAGRPAVEGSDAGRDGAELTPREFDLLYYPRPARLGGQQRELSTQVWQAPYGGADKTVDVHLSWLRRKLGETAQAPRFLHTVRGVGVKLSPPPR